MRDYIEIANEARTLFEQLMETSNLASTKGVCLDACILLSSMLSMCGHNVKIRGGDGLQDGGFFTHEGSFGHYWCEIEHDGELLVVDITADQFGFEKVYVCNTTLLSWPRYVPGDQSCIETHIESYRTEMNERSSNTRRSPLLNVTTK